MKLKASLLVFCLSLCFTLEMRSQLNPLDTVESSLKSLITEMDAGFDTYKQKYKPEGVTLHGVTYYEYNSQHDMVCEKSVTSDKLYMKQVFDHDRLIENLSISSTGKHLELKRYSEKGQLLESQEYGYGSAKHEVYTYTHEEPSIDTLITFVFSNGLLQHKYVHVLHPDGSEKETYSYRRNDSKPDSKSSFDMTPDKKDIARMYFKSYDYPHETETVYLYNKQKQKEKRIERNPIDSTFKETLYFYDQNGHCIREEEYNHNAISFTRYNEYDAAGDLIHEKGIGASGIKVYECIYEYNKLHQKRLYLYFYMGR